MRGEQRKALKEANRGQEENASARRELAFKMRCERKNYREIADALGVSVSTAFAYVDEYWNQVEVLTADSVDKLRRIELKTLDDMEKRWAPLALHSSLDVSTFKGEAHIELPDYDAGLKAVDRVIKIQERRAKLLGLDMPTRVENSGTVNVVNTHMTRAEFKKRVEEAKENRDRRGSAA